MTKYEEWLSKVQDSEILEELKQIETDDGAIEDRFYRDLAFGTGGLRGEIGAGTNRMNIYTVARATQGYANYLNQLPGEGKSVAIAYDSRIKSDVFSQTAASVFAANGIQVHIYPELMPTPMLSYAVRVLGCDGGIVVTASHNPSKYNGYKVYGADGCQITLEAAKAILAEIEALDYFTDVKILDFKEGVEQDRISYIGEDVIASFIREVSDRSMKPEPIDKNVSIVYTPLNGTGRMPVTRCLEENGYTQIVIPKEQEMPDGHFPTCPYPNPEIREALEVGLKKAKEVGSDLLLATDPDCDRVGAAVRNREGDYTLISGNQMGVMLFDYICKIHTEKGTMPQDPVVVSTIVSTPMVDAIAAKYGVEVRRTLTGFKFIGEQIGFLEKDGQADRYIFGFEESYGYLSGSHVRDKDGVNAALLICEMFAYYKAQGQSLLDVLEALYQTYGYYGETLQSIEFAGAAGAKKMEETMTRLRTDEIGALGEYSVTERKDYNLGIQGLPKSDVLEFDLDGGSKVLIRPSGTEPKMKMYYLTKGTSTEDRNKIMKDLEESFQQFL